MLEENLEGRRVLFPDKAVDALVFTSKGDFFAFACGKEVSLVEMSECAVIYTLQVPQFAKIQSLVFEDEVQELLNFRTESEEEDREPFDQEDVQATYDVSVIMDVEPSAPPSLDPVVAITPQEAAAVI